MKLTIELRVVDTDSHADRPSLTAREVIEFLKSDNVKELWGDLMCGERRAIYDQKKAIVGFIELENTDEL